MSRRPKSPEGWRGAAARGVSLWETATRDHERFSNDPRWRRTTTSVLPPAPDDYSILLVDPNEMLRFDSPVQTDFRIARADISLRGRKIKDRR